MYTFQHFVILGFFLPFSTAGLQKQNTQSIFTTFKETLLFWLRFIWTFIIGSLHSIWTVRIVVFQMVLLLFLYICIVAIFFFFLLLITLLILIMHIFVSYYIPDYIDFVIEFIIYSLSIFIFQRVIGM